MRARKGKTLAALEKAAMRWYSTWRPVYHDARQSTRAIDATLAFLDACAAHAASKKRKGTK